MEKIEHIGIAVDDLEAANKKFALILNQQPYKEEAVESEGVTTSFFQTGESKIELLQATKEDSPIAKFIQKRGGGMHHIAFAVSDIKSEMARLSEAGIRLLNEEPKDGADNKLICFLHPKDTYGVLIELCQDKS